MTFCCCSPAVMVLASLFAQVAAGEGFALASDGSVKASLPSENGRGRPVVFRFGLPSVPPERRWERDGVCRGLWVTNGVRYLATVLVGEAAPSVSADTAAGPNRADQDFGGREVLLVNIEGENTNREYAEAFAELALEIEGKRQPLELKGGLVWRVQGESRHLVGALDIPESGIRVTSGDALKFYGNIPPSLKGSMTLKVPLAPLMGTGPEAPDWLIDLEFEAVLRRLLRPRDSTAVNANN